MSLKVSGLTRSFHQGDNLIQVLEGLDLTAQNGETVAILGESGSGKSTLLSLLAGLDRPDAGEIVIDGCSITQLSENKLTQFRAENIGIVFQQFHLMSNLTALENVALPLEIRGLPKPELIAQNALDEVGLGHRVRHYPYQLSGGEKQRVAIARALILKPKLLLADEPSGSLDIKTGAQIMDLLFAFSKQTQMTTLLVTHSAELAHRCQRRLQLESGVLKELS